MESQVAEIQAILPDLSKDVILRELRLNDSVAEALNKLLDIEAVREEDVNESSQFGEGGINAEGGFMQRIEALYDTRMDQASNSEGASKKRNADVFEIESSSDEEGKRHKCITPAFPEHTHGYDIETSGLSEKVAIAKALRTKEYEGEKVQGSRKLAAKGKSLEAQQKYIQKNEKKREKELKKREKALERKRIQSEKGRFVSREIVLVLDSRLLCQGPDGALGKKVKAGKFVCEEKETGFPYSIRFLRYVQQDKDSQDPNSCPSQQEFDHDSYGGQSDCIVVEENVPLLLLAPPVHVVKSMLSKNSLFRYISSTCMAHQGCRIMLLLWGDKYILNDNIMNKIRIELGVQIYVSFSVDDACDYILKLTERTSEKPYYDRKLDPIYVQNRTSSNADIFQMRVSMLEEIPNVTGTVADKIVRKYPSLQSLLCAYENIQDSSPRKEEKLRKNLLNDAGICGKTISQRVYQYIWSQHENEVVK